MKKYFYILSFLFFSYMFFDTVQRANAQCLVLNEVLINGAGSCDGWCNPNTEEWTEIYNTCDTAVDASCYILTNGEFSVVFPTGTIVPARGYLVVGSNNSGVPVNINLANCNCASGTLIGTFVNARDQVILTDPSSNILDGIYWGGGNFPVAITTGLTGSCFPVNVKTSAPGNKIVNVGYSGGQGCSIARTCDGGNSWVQRCGSAVSRGKTNGRTAIPDFIVSDSIICSGSCVNFTDLSSGSPSSWKWTFDGGNTDASVIHNPANICYNNVGNYDVTLKVTNSCGSASVSKPNYIHVINKTTTAISALGSASLCKSETVTLQCDTPQISYQWNRNGNPIIGATHRQYTASAAGNYTLIVDNGTCSEVSNTIQVTIDSISSVPVHAGGSTAICNGESVQLNCSSLFRNYQWNLNDIPIQGATNQQYTADVAGNYSLSVFDTICSATSDSITVVIFPSPTATVTPSGAITRCNPLRLLADSDAAYQWLLNNKTINGATDNSYIATVSGNYNVIVYNQFGCSGTSDTVSFSMVEGPVARFTTNIAGLEVAFNSDLSSGAVAFDWAFDDTARSNDANPIHIYNTPGIYHVCLTVFNNSNCSFTLCKDIDLDSLSTDSKELRAVENWRIYPNPFEDNLYIIPHRLGKGIAVIELYDISGRVLVHKNCKRNTASPFWIDTQSLADGIYYLKITTETANYFHPIIKQSLKN